MPNATEEDHELHAAGLFFFERFRAVADAARNVVYPKLTLLNAVRLHCGLVNRDTHVVSSIRLSSWDKGEYIAEQIIQSKYEPGGALPSAHPEDIVEERVDGLKFALDELYARRTWESSNNDDALATIQFTLLLGSYYRTLVDLWNECLWNGWKVRSIENLDLISPSGKYNDVVRAVSRFREAALGIQFAGCLPDIFKSMHHEFAEWPIPKRLCAIEGSGKSRRLLFEDNTVEEGTLPSPLALRILAVDRYFPELLDREFPACPDVSLRLVLDAWEALHWAAIVLITRMPADSSVFVATKLYEYAPTFTRAEVLQIISTSIGCAPDKAVQLLGFFMRQPQDRFDLWLRPLLQIESGRFLPIVAPLIFPNLLRTVEDWTSTGGLKLSERGRLFEQHARREIARALAVGRFDNSGVAPREVKIGEEQIDILLRIGRTLVVIEAKCVLFVTTPYDTAKYFNLLQKAAQQASRKAACVRENISATCNMLGIPHLEQALVLPAVLVNSPLGAGFPIDGVPVVDLTILCRYFDQGFLDHFVRRTPDGNETVGHRERFYATHEEAEASLPKYLATPPHVRRYRDSVTVEWRPLPPVREGQNPIAVGYIRVQLPIEHATFVPSGRTTP